MKQIKFINILLSMLLAVMFTGCLGDGDETVSLEYGNPKKIIIGTWKVTKYTPGNGYSNFKPGTILEFLNDGTFTSSSDDYNHKWVLGDYKDGEPYYGGIYFDDIYYDIISLGGDENGGNGHWVVGKPDDDGNGYDGYWELEKEPSSVPDDIPDAEPDSEEPSGGVGKLISKIYILPRKSANVIQTIKFYYDDTNRVTSIECSGTEEIISNLNNGIRLYYQINDKTMTLYHSKENATKVRGDGTGSGYGYGTLNDMGYVVYDCLNNTQQAMNYGNYSFGEYDYYNYTNKINGETSHLNGADYMWDNGNIMWGCFDSSVGERYNYYTENKANLNLNRLFTHTYRCYFSDNKYEDVYGLALCGYIGNKDKDLLLGIDGGNNAKFSYTFDSNGYPTKIIYSPINLNGNVTTYEYDCFIEYTTDIGFVLPKY